MINYLLSATLFLIPFYVFRFSLLGVPTNIFEIFVLISFLITCCSLLVSRKRPVFGNIWLYVFVLTAVIAVFFSSDKTTALGILKGWFLIPMVFYWTIINLFGKLSRGDKQHHVISTESETSGEISCESKDLSTFARDDIKFIIWPLYSSLLIVSIWAILQKIGVVHTLFYQVADLDLNQYLADPIRVFGPFNSPNSLAMYLVPTLFISLFNYFPIKNIYLKTIFIISLSVPLAALYFSGSRAGLIALVFGILVISIRQYIATKSKLMLSTILLAVVLIATGMFLFLRPAENSRAESNSSRIDIYKYSSELGKSHPIFGIGLGDFQSKIADVSAGDISFREKTLPYALHPHNVFLATWLYLGVFGLIAFLVILFQFYRQSFRSKADPIIINLLMAAMTAILVHGLFDTTYFKNDLSAIFWLIIAIKILYGQQEIATTTKK